MTVTRWLIHLASVAVSLVAAAAPLRIAIEYADTSCRSGVVMVTPFCTAPPCQRESIASWRIDKDDRVVVMIDAPDADRWTVGVQAERCWAPAVNVGFAERGRDIAMRVWRSATVSGRLKFPDEKTSVRAVPVRIQSDAVPATELQCPVTDDRFLCTVPATALDLRIAPEGWAPQYRWTVQPRTETTVDVGEVKFDRGGTITGFVQIAGDAKLQSATIDLAPALSPPTRGYHEGERRINARAQRSAPPRTDGESRSPSR